MALPQASEEFYTSTQQQKLAAMVIADRLWSRMDPRGNWSEQFTSIGVLISAVVARTQQTITTLADRYVTAVLAELGMADNATTALLPDGFAGWSGNGGTVDQALGWSVAAAGKAYSRQRDLTGEADPDTALAAGGNYLEAMVSTILADTARAATSAAITSRETGGYVRMLNPPSCSRCVVLAGKFYRWDTGFQRHPQCDCVHIPSTESLAGDLTVNPGAYFQSLSDAEQDKAFTKAGAQAIRDGADVGQVVNARRGMTTAQQITRNDVHVDAFMAAIAGGVSKTEAKRIAREAAAAIDAPTRLIRDSNGLYTTDEGASLRGRFARLQEARITQGKKATWTRLMPEGIYELASGDRAKAIELLQLYGYLA